jgi:phosphopantothenate synthetase
MLSPHEFSNLMVIKYGVDYKPDSAEIDELRRLRLVTPYSDTSWADTCLLPLTDTGYSERLSRSGSCVGPPACLVAQPLCPLSRRDASLVPSQNFGDRLRWVADSNRAAPG